MNRRSFLAGLPATAALAAQKDRIAIGIIGSGNRGRRHIEFINASRGRAEVVALADVDDDQIAQSVKLLARKPAVYRDYRKLLEHRGLDAIVVSSPNFLLAPVGISLLLLQGLSKFVRNAYTAVTGRELA